MTEEKKYKKFLVSQKALVYDYSEKKFLLLKLKDSNAYFAKKYGQWDAPGGRADENESLDNSLEREIKEEIGDVKFEIESIVGFDEIGYRTGDAVVVWYLAKYISGELSLTEHSEYRWEEAKNIINNKEYNPWIREAIKKANQYLEKEKSLDSWRRCQADFENYKKDQEKAREEFMKFSKTDMISQILPVLDNFEASLRHVPQEKKENGWVEGIVHIKRQIEDILRNNGVEEIPVKIGDKLDPEIHEAMAGKGEKVKKVAQKGYRMNGRIIRAAKIEVE